MSQTGMSTMIVYAANARSIAGLAEELGVPLVDDLATLAAQIEELRPDAIVLSVGPADGATARPLLDWQHDEWMAAADAPQFEMLAALQAIYAALAGRPAAIILVGPSIAQTGAAGHVALATASEGQRGMMKSIARQWGPQISFAWLSVWPPLIYPQIADTDLPEQCELGPFTPPLGQRPGWPEVALAVRGAVLASSAMTGQTMIVDGGEWMLS